MMFHENAPEPVEGNVVAEIRRATQESRFASQGQKWTMIAHADGALVIGQWVTAYGADTVVAAIATANGETRVAGTTTGKPIRNWVIRPAAYIRDLARTVARKGGSVEFRYYPLRHVTGSSA